MRYKQTWFIFMQFADGMRNLYENGHETEVL